MTQCKVLVALNDGAQRMMLKAILCRYKHEVDVCTDGDEAWKLMHGQQDTQVWPYDIVFLDCNLSHRPGCQMAEDIREEERQKGVTLRLYVVGVVRALDEENKKKCLEAGMDTVIAKPFERTVLKQILDAAVQASNPSEPRSPRGKIIQKAGSLQTGVYLFVDCHLRALC